MENKSHALAAGAFVLLISALLVAMAAWLSRDTTERRLFEISSAESVTGLQPQAGVRYKGVLVGRVTAVALDKVKRGQCAAEDCGERERAHYTVDLLHIGFSGGDRAGLCAARRQR